MINKIVRAMRLSLYDAFRSPIEIESSIVAYEFKSAELYRVYTNDNMILGITVVW